jgi:predicted NUDIX family phosphoesterase
MHYVVIAQDEAEVLVFDRMSEFAERRLDGLSSVLDLQAIGIAMPVADIYWDTGIGG